MNPPPDPKIEAMVESTREYPGLPRATAALQLFQGIYYIIVGLLVALGLTLLGSSTVNRVNLNALWPLRICGSIVFVLGLVLLYASRQRTASTFTLGAPIAMAMLLVVVEVLGMFFMAFPTTFMVDTFMEFCFLIWWGITFLSSSSFHHRVPPATNGMRQSS